MNSPNPQAASPALAEAMRIGGAPSADLTQLGAHMLRCNGSRGRWFGVACIAEAVDGFVAPRLMTTLALASVAVAITSLVG